MGANKKPRAGGCYLANHEAEARQTPYKRQAEFNRQKCQQSTPNKANIIIPEIRAEVPRRGGAIVLDYL